VQGRGKGGMGKGTRKLPLPFKRKHGLTPSIPPNLPPPLPPSLSRSHSCTHLAHSALVQARRVYFFRVQEIVCQFPLPSADLPPSLSPSHLHPMHALRTTIRVGRGHVWNP
jgi:hypothetical protein